MLNVIPLPEHVTKMRPIHYSEGTPQKRSCETSIQTTIPAMKMRQGFDAIKSSGHNVGFSPDGLKVVPGQPVSI